MRRPRHAGTHEFVERCGQVFQVARKKAHLGGLTVKKHVNWNCNWKAFEIQGALESSLSLSQSPHPLSLLLPPPHLRGNVVSGL